MDNVEPKARSKGFFEYFPAPRFLKMSTVGLAFSDDAIRVIEFIDKPTGFVLGRFGEIALPKGSINGGYINDVPALVRILKEIKDRKKLSFVRASLPEEKGYVFTIRIPELTYGEMRSSIEYKIEENAPVNVSDVVFDFNIIPDSLDENNTVEVVVSVLPEKVVSTYVSALQDAEIEPVAFEIESQAVARSVISRNENGVYAIVNLFPHKVGLYIVKKNVVVFTSTVSLLERDRNQDTESFILEQIEKLLIFWTTRIGDNIKQSDHISLVRLVGDFPNIEKLEQFLSAGLVIPVQIGNVWENAFSFNKHIPEIKKTDSLRFSAAVGLALPIFNE